EYKREPPTFTIQIQMNDFRLLSINDQSTRNIKINKNDVKIIKSTEIAFSLRNSCNS
ncbi:hypothetical protein BLOT_012507, partial [Blomia tropicalis]